MNLGGNLPDSIAGYLEMGHGESVAQVDDSKDTKAQEAPR